MAEKNLHIISEDDLKNTLYAVSQSDQEAFTLLLRAFQNKVYTQAITYLKSAELAKEITQDVFLKIWNNRDRLIAIESFSDYLFILSRNEVISALRKKKIVIANDESDPEEFLLRPDLQLQFKETYNKILKLIDQLPPVRKKVFSMSRLEERSYEEIGQQLGISRNGVKDHIVKALNYLRTHFYFGEDKITLLFVGMGMLFQKYF